MFEILKEPRMDFLKQSVLCEIENLLKKGSVVSDNEKGNFAREIFNVVGYEAICFRILKLLWPESGKLKLIFLSVTYIITSI